MVLADLKIGEEAVIVKVKGYGAFRKRLNEMGFIRGKVVKAVKRAPGKGAAIEYAVMGYEVSLRRSEAAFVEIASLQEAAEVVGVRGELREVVEEFAGQWKERDKNILVALVGNPNAGKTSLFNRLCRLTERVGNYGGVTVEAKKAAIRFGDYRLAVVDLPGAYSLSACSSEERFVREYITGNAPDVIINVVDASNLERNLYLSTQLIDMDVKGVIALNMYDELEQSGASFDYRALGKMIGMPIIPTVAAQGKGKDELLREVIEVYEGRGKYTRHVHVHYGPDVEEAIVAVRAALKDEKDLVAGISPRFLALKLLEGDAEALRLVDGYERVLAVCREQAARLEAIYGEPVEALVTDARYGFISGALKETYRAPKGNRHDKSHQVDSVLTDKWLGIPLLLAFLGATVLTSIFLGKFIGGWIEWLLSWIGAGVGSLMDDGPLRGLLVDGIIEGVGSVLVFLPNILIIFFFISFMEDSGYMARAAFIMDKLMHKIGLHGKGIFPIFMGFGCNVPAIMAARIMENKNDRLLSILVNPFATCTARLPVYTLFAAAFFPGYDFLIVIGVYIAGILTLVAMSKLFKKLFFNKEEAPFVMELPPYRVPTVRTTALHMCSKAKQFLKKMFTGVLLITLVIWAAQYFPVNKEREEAYERERVEITRQKDAAEALREQQILAMQRQRQQLSRLDHTLLCSPLEFDRLEALGYFPLDNARADAFAARREAIDRQARRPAQDLQNLDRDHATGKQVNSYLGRAGRWMEPVWEPLGFDWRAGVSLVAGWAAKEVVFTTMSVLYLGEDVGTEDKENKARLGKKLRATYDTRFAILFILFVLLYSPCLMAILKICKEAGLGWGLFVMTYTTALAWITCYIINTFITWIS
ncbi:MAG: ferrous iron transport protein B [Odoribacteraceae bacterium]|jgi:ferrous iron transport protein B|nr:ferrous iron transport protein B [Odoribacteraceae bacterium]